MNKTLYAMVIGLATLLLLTFSLTAGSDTAPPQVISFDFEPKEVNTLFTDKTITFTARFTDDLSGLSLGGIISPTGARFTSNSGQSREVHFVPPTNLVSGDTLDGIYVSAMTVPHSGQTGEWRLQVLLLADEAGNTNSLSLADAITLGFPTNFRNTDDPHPVFLPVSLRPAAPIATPTATPSETATPTATATPSPTATPTSPPTAAPTREATPVGDWEFNIVVTSCVRQPAGTWFDGTVYREGRPANGYRIVFSYQPDGPWATAPQISGPHPGYTNWPDGYYSHIISAGGPVAGTWYVWIVNDRDARISELGSFTSTGPGDGCNQATVDFDSRHESADGEGSRGRQRQSGRPAISRP